MSIPESVTGTQNVHEASQLITQVALVLLIPLMLVFAFVVFLFYRQHREAQIKKQAIDLELKALRAQINPHFIFNCLNSIYQSIVDNKNEEAAKYLLKFSWLTRRILENSDKRWISLSEDLEILRAYLDLEQMRSGRNFEYEIHVDEILDIENTSAIMLIVQPFVENSIWHAFQEGKPENKLTLSIRKIDNNLHYELIDNGGNQLSKQHIDSGKKRSMGIAIVREQLKSISILEKNKSSLELETLYQPDGNAFGQKVTLYYPHRELH